MDNTVKEVNNTINLIGEIIDDYKVSHEVFGEVFYSFKVKINRLSEQVDYLPIIVSERIFEKENMSIGNIVKVSGQVRSYNKFIEEENRNRLIISVFVNDIEVVDQDEKLSQEVIINGFICKPPVYRTTPFGREISDMLLAVNRAYNKSDYIPCIAWGRNAKYTSKLEVGENIIVTGRLQSRIYNKKDENGEAIEKVAYEISVSKIEKVKTEE